MAAAEKPVLSRYRDRMDKAIAALKEEFGSLRTGRASASLLDQVMVEAYGSTTPLNAVASISVPEPRQISVSVWDRGVVVSVEKAIRAAGLGLNPVSKARTCVFRSRRSPRSAARISLRSPASTPSSRRSRSATFAATPTTT